VPPILIGPRPEKGDIGSRSDGSGFVEMRDIPPGNYYLVVWAPYNWSIAQVSDVDSTPHLIKLEPNQRALLEVIYLSWP
jgi:hypothetical protein